MTTKRICLFSFVITLGIWIWFSWPLPHYFNTAIPAAAHIEPAEVQPLIPGDHLQFMYYCWLAGDMVFGKTPLFCNLYEFNTGEAFAEPADLSAKSAAAEKAEANNTMLPRDNPKPKEGGYRPDAYYFPFSFVYAVSALAGQSASFGRVAADGRAFGWNFTGFISLWLTFFLTWLLARRYTKESWMAGCAALIAITLPFRWINLCGGSPAGFAMAWIPAIFLGIDLAVRDGKSAGGIMAGLALLFASWTDNHIFFFGALAAPFWTLIAVGAGLGDEALRCKQRGILAELRRSQPVSALPSFDAVRLAIHPCSKLQGILAKANKKWQNSWQNIFAALLPIPIFLGGALAFPTLMQMLAGTPAASQYLGTSVGARAWREIALFSPSADGFFTWLSSGVSSHIYIGFSAFTFLTAGLACLIFDAFRRQNDTRRRLLIMVLLLAGIAGIMALALGTNGPTHAILLRICRKIIPPYAMIRQPAKIFCLLPSFLAVAAGISLSAIFVHLKTRPVKVLVAFLFCAAVTGEYVLRVNPTISILDNKQGAYEAVAKDAASAGKAPHALVVPLWPGDSHYSSIYQYYASLYRVRMVNGYNPIVSKFYFENVFRRYESVNQGWLTDEQIDGLLRRKIEYVILHEDLFPEKVSPFPVGWTLKQFLVHKRLQFIKQDGRVWAFKMLPKPNENNKLDPAGRGNYSVILNEVKDLSHTNSTAEIPRSARNDDGTLKFPDVQLKMDHWSPFACARNWQAENCARGNAKVIRDDSPARDVYAVLDKPGNCLLIPPLRVTPAPQLCWMIRARGEGIILAETFADGKGAAGALLDISEDEWTWLSVPIPNLGIFVPLNLKLAWENGSVDCDQILLSAGEWIPPSVGRTIDLPAPAMFHAGYTSLSDDTVVLEKEREAKALIFYGPKLPLEKGRYRIELVFSSDAPKGVLLGQFNVKRHDRDYILNWIPVMAGGRSLTEFTQLQNVPMYLEFRFLGNGSLKINGIKLTRLE